MPSTLSIPGHIASLRPDVLGLLFWVANVRTEEMKVEGVFRFSDMSAALILAKRQQKMFSSFKNTLRKLPLREDGETLAMSNPIPRTQALPVAVILYTLGADLPVGSPESGLQ